MIPTHKSTNLTRIWLSDFRLLTYLNRIRDDHLATALICGRRLPPLTLIGQLVGALSPANPNDYISAEADLHKEMYS